LKTEAKKKKDASFVRFQHCVEQFYPGTKLRWNLLLLININNNAYTVMYSGGAMVYIPREKQPPQYNNFIG
jgi:hypothetical protein